MPTTRPRDVADDEKTRSSDSSSSGNADEAKQSLRDRYFLLKITDTKTNKVGLSKWCE